MSSRTRERQAAAGETESSSAQFAEPSAAELQTLRTDVSANLRDASSPAQRAELEALLQHIDSEAELHESRKKAQEVERAKTIARLARINPGQKEAPAKAPVTLSIGAHVTVDQYGPATVTQIRPDGSIAVRYDADGSTWSRVQQALATFRTYW